MSFKSGMGDSTYGISYQLRPELQGGGTSDDGSMFEAVDDTAAFNVGRDMAKSGKYVWLTVYHWNTGNVVFEQERF